MAHNIRPEAYIAMDNFYTSTARAPPLARPPLACPHNCLDPLPLESLRPLALAPDRAPARAPTRAGASPQGRLRAGPRAAADGAACAGGADGATLH